MKEFEQLQSGAGELEGVTAHMVNDEITHWKATFRGPADTPYAGGAFCFGCSISNGLSIYSSKGQI